MIYCDFCNLFLIFYNDDKSTCTNALCIKWKREKKKKKKRFEQVRHQGSLEVYDSHKYFEILNSLKCVE